MRIAFIGFGEAAQAFTAGWRQGAPVDIAAYDILFADPARADTKRAECAGLGVRTAPSPADAIAGATMIFSAVTADQVQAAAESIQSAIAPGQMFLDLNSAAPFRKAAAAARLAERGAATLDVAVMAPVHPQRHRTPLLISGPAAQPAAPLLTDLGMVFDIVSDRIGDASTVKMVRSIAIKGIESVTMECVTAAHALGVADRVIPTISAYLAQYDFASLADNVCERVAVHGQRRAAEMREVSATLAQAGLSHFLPDATAAHQQWVADQHLSDRFDAAVPRNWSRIVAALLTLPQPQ